MDLALKLFDESMVKGTKLLLMHTELEDEDEVARRLSVCHSNAGICYNKKRDKCIACTCYMESKATMLKHINPKANGRVEITHCPLANWGKALSQAAYEAEKEISNYYRRIDNRPLLT